jgi:hypothetical protein
MTKHFVLKLNPDAKFEWERCALHHPITAEQPSLATLVADAVGGQAGSYLVSVKLEVSVLEQEEEMTMNYAVNSVLNAGRNASEKELSLPEDFQIPALAECVA